MNSNIRRCSLHTLLCLASRTTHLSSEQKSFVVLFCIDWQHQLLLSNSFAQHCPTLQPFVNSSCTVCNVRGNWCR